MGSDDLEIVIRARDEATGAIMRTAAELHLLGDENERQGRIAQQSGGETSAFEQHVAKLNQTLERGGPGFMLFGKNMSEIQSSLQRAGDSIDPFVSKMALWGPIVIAGSSAVAALSGGVLALAGSLGAAILGIGAMGLALGATVLPSLLLVTFAIHDFKNALKEGNTGALQLHQSLGQFNNMLDQTTSKIYSGMAAALNSLAPVLNSMKPLLEGLGEAIGHAFATVGAALASTGAINFFNQALQTAAAVVAPLTSILISFGSILGEIAQATMPVLIDWLNKFASWAANIKMPDLHTLTGQIQGLVAEMDKWFAIIGNVGMGLYGMLKASYEASGPLMDSFQKITKEFANWANSASGRDQIRDFVTKMVPLMESLFKLAWNVGKAIIALGAEAAPFVKVLADELSKVFDWLSKHPSIIMGVVAAFVALKVAIEAIKFAKFITDAQATIEKLGGLSSAMSGLRAASMVTLSVGLIGAEVAVALVLILNSWTKLKDEQKKYQDSQPAFQKQMDNTTAQVKKLNDQGLKPQADHLAKVQAESQKARAEYEKIANHPVKNFFHELGLEVAKVLVFINPLTQAFAVGRVVMAQFGATIMSALGAAFNWLVKALEMVGSTFLAVWNGIYAAVWSVMVAIYNILMSIWTTISGFIVGVLTGIYGVVSGIFSAIGGFISGVMGAIFSTISSVWNSVVGAVSGALSAVWNAVVSAFNSVLNFIGGLMGQFADVGSNIMNAIAGAISNAAGAVMDAIAGAIGDAIHFAKHILGIGSPSRVFMEMGGWMMEGMAIGIANSAGMVNSALSGVTPGGLTVNANAAGQARVSGAGSPLGGSTTRNVDQSRSVVINNENHFHNDVDVDAHNKELGWRLTRAGA